MLAGLPAGASRSFVAMVHHGGEAVPVRTLVLRWEGDIRQANCSCLGVALQQSIGTEVFSFSQRFFTHPQENLHREQSCSVKFHIQANKHKTHWEKIPSQALLFASINLSFCLASLLVKKGLWRVPPQGSVFLGCWGYISMPADSYFLHCNLSTYNRNTFSMCSSSSHSYFHHPLLQILHSAHPPFDMHVLFYQIMQANSCSRSTPIWNIASNYRRQICLLIFKICQWLY